MSAGGPVIVTGAAGFLGSVLTHQLLAAGYPCACVDDPGTDQRFRNLAGAALSDFWTPQDFLARVEAGRGLPRPAAVVHLGACSSTTESDAAYLMRNNFAYTRALATWCLERGVRFIYASSAATYGDGEAGYTDGLETLPRLRPRNKYAFSKHAFDLWAWRHGAFANPGGISGLKYFNVYGPNEYHKGEMRSMVLKAFEQIEASGVVRLFKSHRPQYGDGEQRRDFLYAEDAMALTAWFLEHPEATGIFNLGSGAARSWNDLARAVFAAAGRVARIEYFDMPAGLREAYQYDTQADIRRLRSAGCDLGIRPLEDGVRTYVQRYLAAPDRYFQP